LKKKQKKSKIKTEKINLKNNIKNQNKEKIIKLTKEREELIKQQELIKLDLETLNKIPVEKEFKKEKSKNKASNKKIKYFVFLIIFSIIFTLFQINIFQNNVMKKLSYLLIPIYLLFILIDNIIENKNKSLRKNEEELKRQLQEEKEKYIKEKTNSENIVTESRIKILEEQLEEIINENKELDNEIKIMQIEIDHNMDFEIKKLKEKYACINLDEMIEDISVKNIKYQLSNIQENIKNDKIKLNTFEIAQKNIDNQLEDLIILQEEYKTLEEEKEFLEKQNTNIELTKKYLYIAYEKMKNQISPKFTENLSKNISIISDGKYTKVAINDEEGLIVENEYGEYIPASRISIGTIDQLYLSLRLSMIDEISEERMPIILDEAFAYYDDERLKNVLEFLIKQSSTNQIIIFTCTEREQKILNDLNIKYNLVELSH